MLLLVSAFPTSLEVTLLQLLASPIAGFFYLFVRPGYLELAGFKHHIYLLRITAMLHYGVSYIIEKFRDFQPPFCKALLPKLFVIVLDDFSKGIRFEQQFDV